MSKPFIQYATVKTFSGDKGTAQSNLGEEIVILASQCRKAYPGRISDERLWLNQDPRSDQKIVFLRGKGKQPVIWAFANYFQQPQRLELETRLPYINSLQRARTHQTARCRA
jgi:hypothetical protein